MKQLIAILSAFIVISAFQPVFAQARSGKIQWLTNYEQAVTQSKDSSKPIVLFFTGSDWCSWCKKLEEEVFNTPEFAQDTGDKFIFVRLDFPLNSPLPANLTAQNKQLQKKFDIRSFPTVVVLDYKQQQIGVTGYRPGGGKQYAAHLFKMVSDYSSYREKMQTLHEKKLSGGDLKQLYEKAKELSLENDAIQIVKEGMKSDEKLFFLVERYRFLVDEGHIADKEAVALRAQLLDADPHNKELTHYQVAVIDFESCCEQMQREKYSPETAVAPLVTYIEKFGTQDKSHLWRLQMIISQVYFDQNNLSEALKYARDSYDSAPSSAQPEIAMAIKNIQSQLAVKQ